MNAHDQRLINEVARVWIEGGGDSEGIAGCWTQIQEAVAELERENSRMIENTPSEQNPCEEEAAQFQCTVCGRIGAVGRCCGRDTRSPLNDTARKEVAEMEANRKREWKPE